MIGQTISHYSIREKLGAGGMGEVYLAEDSILNRKVALKILPAEFTANEDRLRRFIREAKAACAINHPHVAHIYEIGETKEHHFIAMEFIEGEPLSARIRKKPFTVQEIVQLALQVGDALQVAHSKGIIHRDIKPANIMLDTRNNAKLVDFGLAKIHMEDTPLDSRLPTMTRTETGLIMGTLPYMSPEQLLGKPLDQRTDLFSLGVVLYELATQKLPFEGQTPIEISDGILHKIPASIGQWNQNIPSSLMKIINKLLDKDQSARYQRAEDLLTDLRKIPLQSSTPIEWSNILRKPSVLLPLIAAFIAISSISIWMFYKSSKASWARDEALLQITKLVDQGRYAEAVELGFEAEKYIPKDPLLKTLWASMSIKISIQTTPPGADVAMQEYKSSGENWKLVGKSPITKFRLPKGYARWKITKDGYQPIYFLAPRAFWEQEVNLTIPMEQYKNIPSGMIRIPGLKSDSLNDLGIFAMPVQDDFWMDEFEVSNKDFKKFVDSGGYQAQRFWKVPFIKNGVKLAFDDAMNHLHDSTNRRGPLDWEVGNYPKGQDNFPVTGISWYEAAAYAEYVGKSLPTVHHWARAAGAEMNYQIIPLSNFDSTGPMIVTDRRSENPFGTYNMAGNVKEWCWNETAKGNRFILGGSYAEPGYKFTDLDELEPFVRLKTSGLRCVKYLTQTKLTDSLFTKFIIDSRDYAIEKPVDDTVFQVYKTFYSYEKTELNAKVESSEEQSYLRKEKTTFDAAYGKERMAAFLFLPLNQKPSYQTVLFLPGSDTQLFNSSENIGEINYPDYLDFLVRSGRAVVYPVYKGTFERGGGPGGMKKMSPEQVREWRIQIIKDVSRTLDYLETRDDLDKSKIAFYGYSWGGRVGAIVGAVEDRFKTMILLHGGFPRTRRAPETDEINFAKHVRIPVLMINGKYDSNFPVETSQNPMFQLFGTPEKDKKHLLFETGHTSPRNEVIKIVLDWLDRYLGKVE